MTDKAEAKPLFEKLKKWWLGDDSARALPEDENKKALADFVQNVYWGEDLSSEEAKQNVEMGILEILWPEGGHRANGLLITTNGFFVTSRHCVDGDLKNIMVRDFLGMRHRIQRVCCVSKRRDLALVKADFSGEPLLMRYKYFREENFGKNPVQVVGLTRWNGKLVIRGGYTQGKTGSHFTKNLSFLIKQISLDMYAQPGDSGGVVVSADGRLIGTMTGNVIGIPFLTFCARWFDALQLITAYCARK